MNADVLLLRLWHLPLTMPAIFLLSSAAVSKGCLRGSGKQDEVLGMTKSQIFFQITLLQMVKRVVPPMSNEIITLVKDTSLARIIAAYELTFTGYSFMKSDGITHGHCSTPVCSI